MKKPFISTKRTEHQLVGTDHQSSWVHGVNCVYQDSSVATYRVAIKTPGGWRSYGHFHDLGTAAYVANVAILAEGCEERYELNSKAAKDQQELTRWRSLINNSQAEALARRKYERLQIDLAKAQEEEARLCRIEAERARVEAEKAREANKIARLEAEELRKQAEQARANAEAAAASARMLQEAKETELLSTIATEELLALLTRDISGDEHRIVRRELDRRWAPKGFNLDLSLSVCLAIVLGALLEHSDDDLAKHRTERRSPDLVQG